MGAGEISEDDVFSLLRGVIVAVVVAVGRYNSIYSTAPLTGLAWGVGERGVLWGTLQGGQLDLKMLTGVFRIACTLLVYG